MEILLALLNFTLFRCRLPLYSTSSTSSLSKYVDYRSSCYLFASSLNLICYTTLLEPHQIT